MKLKLIGLEWNIATPTLTFESEKMLKKVSPQTSLSNGVASY